MASKTAKKSKLSVTAHRGDAKTLLAFNLDKASARNLAGFTIQCRPEGQQPFYLLNQLRFETPADHAQDQTLPPNSSFNAPFHKFRWLHVPGSAHQGTKPTFGNYTYTVTPRYFDAKQSMLPLDSSRSVSVTVEVAPFEKKGLALGFTRGFVQSQAFVHHFGPKVLIKPTGGELIFDTTAKAGVSPKGEDYTYAEEYEWLGFTAREQVFAILDEVVAKPSLRLDVFAYDLNEPDVCSRLLTLAKQGRLRILVDNASLHTSTKTKKTPEDQFQALFPTPKSKTDPSNIMRKHFARFAHDKIFIVSSGKSAVKVLTGSTNFSITGLYVNSNHVLVYDDPKVAAKYADVFETVWTEQASAPKFIADELSQETASFSGVPATDVTFSPHSAEEAKKILDALVARINQEGKQPKSRASVLFAVMDLGAGSGPVFPALRALHADQAVFSYGISDNPDGVALYKPMTKRGILVTGKPGPARLPPPFNQVPGIGAGHQIHHKFVVCGFNGKNPVVYCGSSNLALGGEQQNGDNLVTIRDGDVATAFAIEAVALVDHFHFLDSVASKGTAPPSVKKKQVASKSQAAAQAGWFLGTTDAWARPYFDAKDLHSVDRQLFA